MIYQLGHMTCGAFVAFGALYMELYIWSLMEPYGAIWILVWNHIEPYEALYGTIWSLMEPCEA
jgi:hypothetical protein